MSTACIILADGFEEVEAITPIDYLRRARIGLVSAGLKDLTVRGAHGIQVQADRLLSELADSTYDVLIIPGGLQGAEAIAADDLARELIARHSARDKYLAAICAAPALVLGKACRLLDGRRFTCYPGMEGHVPGGDYQPVAVQVDGKLITAAGAGCAQAFALTIIEYLQGKAEAEKIATSILAGL